ncbi:MAG: FAD-dependent oxidoreductase [Acidobacteriales bacterium]|nr:FAD-dependent oxidoreductase [Terriglobales bacterium]
MKTWDAIVIGGGIIGLSAALALRKCGVDVLVIERGQPGCEASGAAAGMLADCAIDLPSVLRPLATASAQMYPEFVAELESESGIKADLRDQGTLALLEHDVPLPGGCKLVSPQALTKFEPALHSSKPALFLKERSVDPHKLVVAAAKTAKHRGIEILSQTSVSSLFVFRGTVDGVSTAGTDYKSRIVVNCAGAWSGEIAPHGLPVRPVKGQMLSVASGFHLKHVIRSSDVYLVPRSDGRILIGATVEKAGFDKRTHTGTIESLRQAAIDLVPQLQHAAVIEAWAGLRPGAPDGLPILAATDIPGYFVATAHLRNGILLAPITGQLMAQLITGAKLDYDISHFSPGRFTS